MARVLVTGAGGYLGSVLVRALLDAQHHLHVLDRFDWGTQPLLSAVGRAQSKVKVFAGHVCDRALLEDALVGVDAVIHLAGIVGYPACDANPLDAEDTNVEGTKRVAAAVNGRPLLFASTGSTYGRVPRSLATEDLPISPLTRYGRNKAEGELFVRDVGGVSLRLATLFGWSHRMRWDLLPHDFAKAAVRDGRLTVYQPDAHRSFLHVQDAAAAFVEALARLTAGDLPQGEIVNVGRAAGNWSKRMVAEAVQGATGCAVMFGEGEDPDQRDYVVGFGKVRGLLPRWTLQKGPGLSETIPEVVRWARCWR